MERAEAALLELRAGWKVEDLGKFLADALRLAALEGRAAALEDGTAFAEPERGQLPFKQKIAFFEQKDRQPSKHWHDYMYGDHDRAFVVAGVTDDDMLADFQTALARAMKEGKGFKWFLGEFDRIAGDNGWNYKGERIWRARTIFETNMRTAHMAGRLAQMTDPKVLKLRPYWQYHHAHTRVPTRPRPMHKSWDGLILPADDDFWKTHFPPNDWLCSCGVTSLSKGDLKRLGREGPDEAPPVTMVSVKDDQGNVFHVPEGIGPGWDYRPGDLWVRGLTPRRVEGAELDGSIIALDLPEPLEALMEKARPFATGLMEDGLDDEAYIAAFMKRFGAKADDAVLFRDKAGEAVPISAEMFVNQAENKLRKQGRHIAITRIAETIIDPDEIWLQVVERSTETTAIERYVKRVYIRLAPDLGGFAAFSITSKFWRAATGFTPAGNKKTMERPRFDYLDKQRGGKLIFKRK